jgi:branched-chain amino acid transport system substrate-binding protein
MILMTTFLPRTQGRAPVRTEFLHMAREVWVTVVTRCLAATWISALSLAATAEPIRIGQSLPLTGPLAAYAKEKLDGATAAVAAINVVGGIRGRSLQLISLDDAYLPKNAVANTRALVAQHRVVALTGYLGVSTIDACLPIFEALRIPVIGLTSGSPTLRQPVRRFVFPVRAPYALEIKKLVLYLKTLGIERVALVSQGGPLGDMGAQAYRQALTAHSITLSASFTLDQKGASAGQIAASLHRTAPQAIVTFITSKPTGELLIAYKALGGTASVYGTSIVGANQLIEAGNIPVNGLILSQVVPRPNHIEIPIVREYFRALGAMAGDPIKPSMYGLEAFIEIQILAAGLKRASGLAAEDIVNGLERLGKFDIGGYLIEYGPGDRTGSPFTDLSIVSSNGKIRG